MLHLVLSLKLEEIKFFTVDVQMKKRKRLEFTSKHVIFANSMVIHRTELRI